MKTLVKKQWLSLGMVAVIIAYLSVSFFMAWGFTTDDAYISWYYARQLADGNGLLWHPSIPLVEGYSNFLWILIAALVIKLGLPLVLSMKLLALSSLFWGLWCLYRFSRLFLNSFLALVPVFIFSHYIGVVWWTVSGLETPLYSALAIFTLWQSAVAMGLCDDNQQKNGVSFLAWGFVTFGLLLLSLTRFEGFIWCIPIGLFILCHGVKVGFAPRVIFKGLGIAIIGFVIPYGLYFGWRLYYFGHWIPNSYSCKALASGDAFVVDLDYLQVLIPFLVLSLPYWLHKKDCRHLLLWLPSVLYVLLLWHADTVIAHFLRLFQAAFAAFSIAPVLGVRQFLIDLRVERWDKDYVTACIVVLVAVIFTQGNPPEYLKMRAQDYQNRTASRLKIVDILNKQAELGDTVLLGDSGIIPFYARKDLVFIDSLCLNNPKMTQLPYKGNLDLYGKYLLLNVKPEWVIANYDPNDRTHGDLISQLHKMQFFKDYVTVSIIKSGVKQQVSYEYYVHQRKKPH